MINVFWPRGLYVVRAVYYILCAAEGHMSIHLSLTYLWAILRLDFRVFICPFLLACLLCVLVTLRVYGGNLGT